MGRKNLRTQGKQMINNQAAERKDYEWQKAEIARLREQVDEIICERNEIEEKHEALKESYKKVVHHRNQCLKVIDKLRKTEDGVPYTSECLVWIVEFVSRWDEINGHSDVAQVACVKGHEVTDVHACYSTREAAERAAKETIDEQKARPQRNSSL